MNVGQAKSIDAHYKLNPGEFFQVSLPEAEILPLKLSLYLLYCYLLT